MTVQYVVASAIAAIGEGEVPSLPDDRQRLFWATVVECAAKAQVLPLLHTRFEGVEDGLVPRWVLSVSECMHDEVTTRSSVLIEVAKTVSERFEREGVPIAFRKGLHVMDLYPNLGGRPVTDIDVLVSPEHAGDALAIAKSLGFAEVPLTRAQRVWMAVVTHNLPPLEYRVPAFGDVGLDITTSLMLPVMREAPDRERVDGMLSRTVMSKNGLPVLSAPDLLLDLVVNSYVVQTTLRYVWRLRFQRLCYFLDLLVAGRQLTEAELGYFRSTLDNDTLLDAISFSIGNLRRLAPHAPTTAFLLNGQPPDTRDVMDTVGQWELAEPYRWRESLTERLQLDRVPADLPRSRAVIG